MSTLKLDTFCKRRKLNGNAKKRAVSKTAVSRHKVFPPASFASKRGPLKEKKTQSRCQKEKKKSDWGGGWGILSKERVKNGFFTATEINK